MRKDEQDAGENSVADEVEIEAASYEARFLDRYAELTDPEALTRAVKDVARGTRIAHALGISHSELVDVVDDEAGRNKLALRFRGRPDLVAAALSDDADAREVGPLVRTRLAHALNRVPTDGPPHSTTLAALQEAADNLIVRYEKLTGNVLSLDVAALAAHGRPALIHLLHTAPSLPRFGAMFAQTRRLSAVPLVGGRRSNSSGSPSAPSSMTPSAISRRPANSASARRSTAASTPSDDEAVRQARIDALLASCQDPTTVEDKTEFPANLEPREDIYYDFSIVVPIDGGEEPWDPDIGMDHLKQLDATGTAAFHALINLGRAITKTLSDSGLQEVYGATLVADIDAHLKILEAQVLDRRSWLREGLRRASRELAAALRLIARTRLHVAPGVSDTVLEAQKLLAALDQALKDYNITLQPPVRLPRSMGPGNFGEATVAGNGFAAIPPHDEQWGSVLGAKDVTPLPNSEWVPSGPYGAPNGDRWYNWIYNVDRHLQTDAIGQLRAYLDGMAAKFPQIEGLKELCKWASTVLVALVSQLGTGTVGSAEYRRKMEQLLGGLANDAAYALATILDELAELITVPQGRRLPYAKRLAIQIVYRQTWVPTGHSKGKMVGYKTLLPGESQQVKRRTFVKTTTEATTADDFAASRQNDFSNTQRETSDVLRETGDKFDFRASASGHVDFAVAGAEVKAETGVALAGTSKNVRNSITEAVAKGSVSYSNKREVKVRELVEQEVSDESVSNLANANQEITANYFYYQLLRNYDVSTTLYDARPVLLVGRDYPTPAQVDEVWLGKHMHDLLFALPAQLAADATPVVNSIEALSRKVIRARVAAARAQSEYELLRDTMLPNLANAGPSPGTLDDRQREALARAAAAAAEVRDTFAATEGEFFEASAKVARVVSHVRENILMYMHRIWQAGSDADRQRALRDETFFGVSLDRLTRGLNRLGFLGEEEIYEYTGPSALVLQFLMELMISGKQVMALNDGTPLKEQLIRRVMTEQGSERASAIQFIEQNFVVTDEDALGTSDVPRSVQIAQDAIVVEAMPGSTPLLEGFKLAHRALDVQRACLENHHLAARIVDKPWMNPKSRDDYEVHRGDAGDRDGNA